MKYTSAGQIRSALHDALRAAPFGRECALLDWPDSAGAGGHLAWMGAVLYLSAFRNLKLSYVSGRKTFSESAIARLPPGTALALNGGGSLGDLRPERQEFCERVVAGFPRRPIIILPQSMHFGDKRNLERAERIFNAHPNLTIFLRCERSLEAAQASFPNCRVALAPDMSFHLSGALDLLYPPAPTPDPLYLCRTDAEQPSGLGARLLERLSERAWQRTLDLRGLPEPRLHRTSWRRIHAAVYQLKRHKMAVTNRLHDHILCSLLDIPHLLLPGTCAMNKSFYDTWTRDLPGCRFIPAPTPEAIEAGLQALAPFAASDPGGPAVRHSPALALARQKLHTALDVVQKATPPVVRAAVREPYLRYVYDRLYPDRKSVRPAALVRRPGDAAIAHSSYQPFVEFKRLLCGRLSMDYRIATPCRAGLVSIVLPVYNGEDYIAESIRSVQAQTFADWELIVVNDGSDDRTTRILDSFSADTRIRLIEQPHRGLPEALTRGFREAGGEFFTWTSADNRMQSGMLRQLTTFLGWRHDTEMVYANEGLIGADGNPALKTDFWHAYQHPPGSGQLRLPEDPGELGFLKDNYIGACFLYRAWAGRLLGPYLSGCSGYEDYEYWLRMNALFRIAHLGVAESFYEYRVHADSLSSRDGGRRIPAQTRELILREQERLNFYLEPFDIVFVGRHPWTAELARAYASTHRVTALEEAGEEALQRHIATTRYSKTIIVATGGLQAAPRLSEQVMTAVLDGNRLRFADFELNAETAEDVEYPLLAAANNAYALKRFDAAGA